MMPESVVLRAISHKPKKRSRTMIKIVTGVEKPSAIRLSARTAKYPFAEMGPGASFFVPCSADDADKTRRSLISCAKTAGVKISTRFLEDGEAWGEDFAGERGVGTWYEGKRVAKAAAPKVPDAPEGEEGGDDHDPIHDDE